jgi:diguanylate cyclase (GGDEF)-like protein/PAS domain S-box-containing protein
VSVRTSSKHRREPTSLLKNYQAQLRQSGARTLQDRVATQSVKLARADAMMARIVEGSFDAVLTVNADLRIETANTGATRTFGFARTDLVGNSVYILIPDFAKMVNEQEGAFAVGQGHRETLARRKSGEAVPVDISISRTSYGAEQLYIVIVRDITELREKQRQLEHQALHDALTGLPNRVLLGNRLEHALAAATRSGKPVALLLLDLDRFKEVNDTLGHHTGDLLLQEVAERLSSPLRTSDTVARLGGDEFAVLLPAVEGENQALELAGRLASVFLQPFEVLQDLRIDVGCSIGVAMFPAHSEEAAKLMQCADVAMYAAKVGPDKVVLYDADKDTNSVRQLTLSGELRSAIANRRLTMEFQPKLHLASRTVKSVEALARWRHPTLGTVPPDEFICHAEQTGLIRPLTEWTFEETLNQLSTWHSQGMRVGAAVNLSARMLHDVDVITMISRLLASTGIPPEALTLEITESAIVLDPKRAFENVELLAGLGVRLSIDDFGTGYSSLAMLQQLPLKELKIDKSFVNKMTEDEAAMIIVRSTIDLAHNLGLEVVAEGVETEEQIEALARLDCDMAQGYFIAHALEAGRFGEWYRANLLLRPQQNNSASGSQGASADFVSIARPQDTTPITHSSFQPAFGQQR